VLLVVVLVAELVVRTMPAMETIAAEVRREMAEIEITEKAATEMVATEEVPQVVNVVVTTNATTEAVIETTRSKGRDNTRLTSLSSRTLVLVRTAQKTKSRRLEALTLISLISLEVLVVIINAPN
jgi:cell division septation protein DedD